MRETLKPCPRYGQNLDFEDYPVGSCYPKKDGDFVRYADHVAREAELMRLLQAYRVSGFSHGDCIAPDKTCAIDYRCDTCKAVDALVVSK